MKQVFSRLSQHPHRQTVMRYIAVGLISVAIDYGLMILLYRGFTTSLPVAASVGFLVGLGANFLLNKYWAFHAARGARHTARQIFLVAGLVGVNLLFTNFFVVSMTHWHIAPELSKPVATALTTLWNYILYQKVIFKVQTPTDLERSMM